MFSAKVHDMIEVALLLFVLWTIWKFFKSVHRSFLQRMFHAYIGKSMTSWNLKHWGRFTLKYDVEVLKLAHHILGELKNGMEDAGPKIRDHALQYGAILYSKTIHVPNHIADPIIYQAIDVLKQFFYMTYGNYFDESNPRCGRNVFQIGVQNGKSGNLPLFFMGRTLDGIMESLRDLKLDDPDDIGGTELVITFSVLTPYTKPGYFYKRYN